MANGVGRFQHGDGDAPWMNHAKLVFWGTKKNTQKPGGQILTNLKTSELKGSKGKDPKETDRRKTLREKDRDAGRIFFFLLSRNVPAHSCRWLHIDTTLGPRGAPKRCRPTLRSMRVNGKMTKLMDLANTRHLVHLVHHCQVGKVG